MPEWIAIIILGIIEGITEFLPISSTAHLLIAEHWLPRQSDLFNIVIQSGAVIAVLPLFPERVHQFVYEWKRPSVRDYAFKIVTAFVITGIGGLLLNKAGFKLPEKLAPIAWAMLIGGIAFLIIEKWLRGKRLKGSISWTVAILVGFGQLVAAVFPGTSRSGATILLMLMMGLNRPLATEFSFLIGIPTMLAAGGLKILQALHHVDPAAPPENWGMVALGFFVSAVVSFIVVKWLLNYIRTHTFTIFGWYRILFAAIIFGMLRLSF
jgi:undecaprenyl-diphosphatase